MFYNMNLRTVNVKYLGRKNESKERKCMEFLLKTLHILFGLDFGFFTHKSLKFRLILKFLFFIHCVAVAVFIYLELCGIELDFGKFWTVLFYVEYLVLILLLTLFKRGTTFRDLQESLDEIDVQLGGEFLGKHSDMKFVLGLFFIYFQHFFITGFSYYTTVMKLFDYISLVDLYVFMFMTPCADVALSCYTFVFYSLYLRLAKLPLLLETNDDYKCIQRLYKEIVDTVEKYKRAFDPVYMLVLICNVPQGMATIYFTLLEFQNQGGTIILVSLGVKYIYVLETLALTIAPALAAEMLTTKAEEIKTILHNKRLLRDVQHKDSLSRFIQYVEARPCQFRVWKLIPLSADLLSMVLSFCVTYLIVIAQFTNLQINN